MIMANMLKTKPGSEKAIKPDKNLVQLVVALYQSIKLGKVGEIPTPPISVQCACSRQMSYMVDMDTIFNFTS